MAVNINVPSQVKTYANLAAFPATGALKTIYIAEDTNKTYRWTGSVYTEISASAAMTWGAIGGTLSNQTDLQNALDAKVPTSRTLTINGVTQDLSANRTFTISTGITIGTTAIASGTVGRILFEGAGNVVQESSSLFWDATNNRLGIGTSTPVRTLDVQSAQPVVRVLATTNTNASAVQLSNFAGDFWIGRENSAGNTFGMAAPAYAGVINSRGDYPLYIGRNDFNNITISTNNNILINTTTDAGFRLDVNGTARVQGLLTLTNNIEFSSYNRTIANSSFPLSAISTNQVRSLNDLYDSGGTNGFTFYNNGGTIRGRIYATGNWYIGSSPTDAGFRLDVNGTARVKGTGTTSTTASLTIQNSAGANLLKMADDRSLFLGVFGSNNYIYFSDNGSGAAIKSDSYSMIFNTRSSGSVFRFSQGGNIDTASTIAELTNLNYSVNTPTLIGAISTANASAQFEVVSTTKGFLPPRMTTTQKNAIASPAAGLMVYDTTLNVISYYNGSMWI